MSAGVLEFTLGLGAGGFNRAIDEAGGKLGGFLSTAGRLMGMGALLEAGVQGFKRMTDAVTGVQDAIAHGAALEHLSKQTGESVRNLFLLERGLKAVGLESSGTGQMLYMMQRSLGGVSEEGIPTAFVFSQLGLSIDALKRMDAPGQIQAIAASMAKLDTASAASAAAKIFGRGSARDFLQLARSTEEFTRALSQNAAAASRMERNAAMFSKFELSLGNIKNKTQDFFAGIAQSVTPGLQAVIDKLNAIDFSRLGEQLGIIITAFLEAFREGTLTELVAESFRVAFEAAVAIAPGIFEKLGFVIFKAFSKPLIYLQAMMEYVVNHLVEQLNKIPGLGKAMGWTPGFKAKGWDETLANRKKEGFRLYIPGAGAIGLDDMESDSSARIQEAKAKIRTLAEPLVERIKELFLRAPKTPGVGPRPPQGTEQLQAAYHPEFTALQKMGFVMTGGSAHDHMADTARNTRDLVFIARQQFQLLSRRGSGATTDFRNR